MTTAAVLNILITANSSQATAALAKTDAQLKKTAAVAQGTSASIGSRVAKGAKYGAIGLGLLGAASVKAAADFESSFAEVRKTVDASEAGFRKLETGLRDMAKEIPISVNELAALAGQAGALGIKSQDLLKFTKTAAELGITTDLSSETAANALARLSNIMGTSSKDFRRLGSTLVELGNKGASTESEIAEMALRIAGAGKQIGLSEDQVLGFASALSSVGINAEAGGSAISRAFITIAEAVSKGGGDLQAFADVAGVSGTQFAQIFEQDAAKAMVLFINGLEKMRKSGGDVFATLESLELNEIRVRDALLRAAGAGDLFNKQLAIGSGEWARNSALTEEAARRYETFDSQVEVLKNNLIDMGISIGEKLLPHLKTLVKEVNDILSSKSLTGEEKFSKIVDLIATKIEDNLPKIAEAGGKLGLKLAGALGRAFLEAPILGKLVIGGLLLRAIGGPGVFGALGVKLGGTLGKKLGQWFLKSAVPFIVGAQTSGGLLGFVAGMAGKLGAYFKSVGRMLGRNLGRGLLLGFAFALPEIVKQVVDYAQSANPFNDKVVVPVPRRQQGGSVVPGSGSGDKVPVSAMVEPGEGLFVLNRNAMGALQAWNERFPRFQEGGAAFPTLNVNKVASMARLGNRKPLRNLMDKIRGISLPEGMQGQIDSLTGEADTFEEYANRAEELESFMDQYRDAIASGVPASQLPAPLTETVLGKTSQEWLTSALDKMFSLRNVVIRAQEVIANQLLGFGTSLTNAEERLKQINKELKQGEREQQRLEQKIESAQKVVQRELSKPGRRRNDTLIAQKRGEIDAARGDLRNVRNDQQGRRKEAGALGRIITGLTNQRDNARTSRETVLGTLMDLQGPGAPMSVLDKLPELGVLGGRIFQTQQRLLVRPNIFDAVGASTEAGVSPSAELLSQLLREANQRFAVSQAQYEVFKSMPPFGGIFHDGGIVPGPVGQERMVLAKGGEIYAGTGGIQVIVNGDIVGTPAGRDPVEVTVGGQRMRAAVKDVRARPSTPGGRKAGVL